MGGRDSPGADEAVGAATFSMLARFLKQKPARKDRLAVATSPRPDAGRPSELVWSLSARSKDLRDARNELRRFVKKSR